MLEKIVDNEKVRQIDTGCSAGCHLIVVLPVRAGVVLRVLDNQTKDAAGCNDQG